MQLNIKFGASLQGVLLILVETLEAATFYKMLLGGEALDFGGSFGYSVFLVEIALFHEIMAIGCSICIVLVR